MGLVELIALAVIGLVAGVLGGLLGIGGSIIMIPAMIEVLGPDQHLYQAAALIVNFFVVVPAVYQHNRAKAVELSTVLKLIPLAILAVLVGVGISELPLFADEGEAYLRMLFGLFLFFVAGSDLYRLLRRSGHAPDVSREAVRNAGAHASTGIARRGRIRWLTTAAVALPTGLVSGLLGVGGGVMAVPLQRRFLGIPIRTAIANSATIIIATALVGATAKNYAYVTGHSGSLAPFRLAVVLIPTAIVGSLVGAKLTHRLPLNVVKIAFFVVMLLAAVRLTYKALQSLQPSDAPTVVRAASAQAVVADRTVSPAGVWDHSTFRKPFTDTIFDARIVALPRARPRQNGTSGDGRK